MRLGLPTLRAASSAVSVACILGFRRNFPTSSWLSLRNKHARRSNLSHRCDLSVLFHELDHPIREFRYVGFHLFIRQEPLIRRAGLPDDRTAARSERDLALSAGRLF